MAYNSMGKCVVHFFRHCAKENMTYARKAECSNDYCDSYDHIHAYILWSSTVACAELPIRTIAVHLGLSYKKKIMIDRKTNSL